MLQLRNIFGKYVSLFLMFLGVHKFALKQIDKHNRIICFYFHNPNLKLFKYLINWLIKHKFTFISTEDLEMILLKKKNIPQRAICISFDDARKELLQNVIPIIDENKIPITIYIPINSVVEGTFWWTYIFEKNSKIKDIADFHRLSYDEKLKVVKEFYQNPKQRQSMTQEEIIELSKNPLITIGGHTMNHFTTANMTETELEFELCESKKILENWTRKTIKYFAYPHGFYSGNETKLLVENKYSLSFTTEAKYINVLKENNLMYLPRFCCFDSGSNEENLLRLVGIWQKIFK